MFPNERLGELEMIGGKPILRAFLPFISLLTFRRELRVIERSKLPIFLGILVHRIEIAADEPTGFEFSGPACGPPGETKMAIAAEYPRPHFVKDAQSLNYKAPLQQA